MTEHQYATTVDDHLMDSSLLFEVAVVSFIVALGNILFGHFEEGTPKWRRVAKFILFLVVLCAVSHYAGRQWFFAVLALLAVGVAVIHGWWLPSKGINGWTGEPRDEYRKLRGWDD